VIIKGAFTHANNTHKVDNMTPFNGNTHACT